MSDMGYARHHDDQEKIAYGQWLDQLRVAPARKAGRCSNGMESDKGTVIHALPHKSGELGKALCGTAPGRRSAGWSIVDAPVSCQRCIRKMEPAS